MSFLTTLFGGRRRDLPPVPSARPRDVAADDGLTKYSRFGASTLRGAAEEEPRRTAPMQRSSSAPVLLHPVTARRPDAAASAAHGNSAGNWSDGEETPSLQFAHLPADDGAATAEAAEPKPTPRPRRTRTRLIGFESSRMETPPDPFTEAEPQVESGPQVQFPVGWLVVRRGPGRGHSFVLSAGMAQIGRDEGQAIQLDFGDTAISRDNHAAIVYDPNSRGFLLGHGGKANIVRLNGKPVLSNETLSDGDEITIGETTLLLKTLCGPGFSWDADGGERDDATPA